MPTFDRDRFRAQRELAGLSREQAAVETGYSFHSVRGIENGTVRPSIVSIGRFARAFGCSVGAFFAEDNRDGINLPIHHLGPEAEAWIKAQLAAAPDLTDEQARRVSAILFHRVDGAA